MPEVFTTLERVGNAENPEGRVPGWLATHPSPEDRRTRIAAELQKLGETGGGTVDREEYLRRLDGLVYGENPREGFFEQNVFYHPELRFRFDFPRNWRTSNTKQAVGAMSPEQDAVVVITLAAGRTAQAAAQQFFSQQAIQRGGAWRGNINDLPAVAHEFAAATEQGTLRGIAAFVEFDGRTYQVLGYAAAERWARHEGAVNQAIGSFDRVRDARLLEVQPARLEIVTVPAGMTVAEFARRFPSTVGVQALATLNGVDGPDRPLRDRLAKRVVGGPRATRSIDETRR
jgi:predicted Zn-dependent protease